MGVLAAIGGSLVLTSLPVSAQQAERIEITGSRIKRVDAEGALPITTINRAQLEASGATTVAEFIRTVTYASAGNFRPQSGSSVQSFAGVDLRGLGAARTLVLLDGRRLPKSPNVGDSVDLNSVPMAAIERVEILTDGASAVYGSDAIGGVVNFITRKDFEGVQLSVGATRPRNEGGDKDELSGIFGVTSEKGRILGGFSHTSRGMVYTNQRPWGQTPGGSASGNNYQLPAGGGHRDADGNVIMVPARDENDKKILIPFNSPIAVPGGCTDPNFSLVESTIKADAELGFEGHTYNVCRYDFNAVAADEASTSNTALFLRGEFNLSEDWMLYSSASISKLSSFGRYAPVPTPGEITIAAGSPNNPTTGTANEEDVLLWHRFAAAGNRDNDVDNTVTNLQVGVQGRMADRFDIDVGVSKTKSTYAEDGRGYIVKSIAENFINSGEYDIYNPSANPAEVLQGMTAQIGRNSVWDQKEVYGTVGFDLFKLGGGTAQALLGAEWRKETYADVYDSLSEAGQVLGSSGNSAGGDRRVTSVLGEVLLPLAKDLELQLAGRYERYSDYGNDFSPKAALRWKVSPEVLLRGSVGKGFRAPSLPILTQKESFSAESVFDPVSCQVLGGDAEDDCQVNTYYAANSALKSEQSKQFSFGIVVDPVNWLSVKADYWNIKIDDTIKQVTAQDIVKRSLGDDPRPIPTGLGIARDPSGVITRIDAGYANEGTLKTSGLDLNVVTNFRLGEWGRLSQNYSYSRVLQYKVNSDDLLGDVGTPRARAVFGHAWDLGSFKTTWNLNYIGKQFETTTSGPLAVGSYITHDVQVSWDTPIRGGNLTVGVLNLGNKQPQLVPYDGRNFNFYLYDSYGRQPYVRYDQKF